MGEHSGAGNGSIWLFEDEILTFMDGDYDCNVEMNLGWEGHGSPRRVITY
jgi:hypothetical protein